MKKPLFFCIALLFLVVIVIVFTGTIQSPRPLRPLYQVEGAGKAVILTFNVLWGDEGELEQILSFLHSNEVEAIFFATGEWVKNYPDAAVSILEHGQHLGNRTVSHPRLVMMGEDEIATEIEGFNKICRETLEYTPAYFRPPYGEYNSLIVRLAAEAGCVTVLWSINAFSLTEPDPSFMIHHLEERLHPGAIVLMHLSPGAAGSLPLLFEHLRWKGYSIGTPRQYLP